MSVQINLPEVTNSLVRTLRPFYLQGICTPDWLEVHTAMIKLGKQAVLEPYDMQENSVGDTLVRLDKLGVLVNEIFCASLWKSRVLPCLMDIAPFRQESSLASEVFWHEYTAIILLESALKYEKAPLSLRETSLDLIDYCVHALNNTFVLVKAEEPQFKPKYDSDFKDNDLTLCERQKRDLMWKIGIRCLSILNHLARNIELLPPNVVYHIYKVHDVPWLLTEAIKFCPWYKVTDAIVHTFVGDSWTPLSGDATSHTNVPELDTWKCIHELLLNPKLIGYYNLNSARQSRLAKILPLLNSAVLDMAPQLWQLNNYIRRIKEISVYVRAIAEEREYPVFESFPLLRDDLKVKAERIGGYAVIAFQQKDFFLCKAKDRLFTLAKSLLDPPKEEVVADSAPKMKAEKCMEKNHNGAEDPPRQTKNKADYFCDNCGQKAKQMCAICSHAYYCSGKCQKEQWPHHKLPCQTSKFVSDKKYPMF